MTNFLHWRKASWALVLWSGYIATWTLITGPGPAMVALWSLAGMIVLGSLLFARQPLFQHGPGLSGLFVWPGRTHWRVVNPHHDLEALAAYGAYRRSHSRAALTADERARIGPGRAAIGARALRNWENEGGATLSPHGP